MRPLKTLIKDCDGFLRAAWKTAEISLKDQLTMSTYKPEIVNQQQDLFPEAEPSKKKQKADEEEVSRTIIDQLLSESKLYRTGKDYNELLDFVVQLKAFAPFNAMLLQIQKPGLRFAASAHEWWHKFGRTIKDGARPLLIMWPFGPVALVYDQMDTEGKNLPEDVNSFIAHGPVDLKNMVEFEQRVVKAGIEYYKVDAGDSSAGLIKVLKRSQSKKDKSRYRIHINKNHQPAVQFCTLVHELGHLFLGHLGRDPSRKIPAIPTLTHAQQELEAESVAYIICERHGVKSKSQVYLSNYVKQHTEVDDIDIYRVTKAAGDVERLLGLEPHMKMHD